MDTLLSRDQIRKRLKAEGYTLARVARDLGVSPTTVNYVVSGRGRSRRVEDHVANILATDPSKIWKYRSEQDS